MNKRFNKGLLFNANYTLSKAEDTGQNSTTFISNFATMVDPFNNDAEKGPASFDRRHRGVVSVHYAPDFLWGFQIGGTGTFESGLPLNPTITINSGAMTASGPTDTRASMAPARRTARRGTPATASVRPAARRSTCGCRKVQPRRYTPDRGTLGSVQHLQHHELHGIRHDEIPRGKLDLRCDHQQGRREPHVRYWIWRSDTASNTLFGPRDMQIGFKFFW